MFRALLLARWHGLSYPKLERALRVRLDFLLFCGFVIGDKMPARSTDSIRGLVKVAHWPPCLRKWIGS
jgi:IS5 family transposase